MTVDKQKMNEIFGSLDKDKPVAICLHLYPDPDAISSAAGFAVLLKDVYGLSSKIYHKGAVSHPQNKTLKNILHIRMEDAESLDINKVSAVVVLDSDIINTGLKDEVETVNVRIDHHFNDRDCNCLLSDVRVIGATATIIFEYLTAFGIDLTKYVEMCTGLIFGIKTDTLDFTSENTTAEDIEAFRLLLPIADKTLMAKINKYPLSEIHFEIETKAFAEREQKGTVLASYVGDVSGGHRDVIATIADSFIRLDSVETVMIVGVVDESLVVSLRNDDSRLDLNEVIAKVFGKENGGAKGYSGGAMFNLGPINLISDKKIRESAINEIVSGFKHKLFEVLGETKDEKEESK
jgi:nanoRNase/pAp phosphatase (c-di-AMP/oligoRNAs hydrolase)